MKPAPLAALTLGAVALALGLYQAVLVPRPIQVAVVDVAGVFHAKEADFSTMLIKNPAPEDRKKALGYAQEFARRYPQAMAELAQECKCLLLDKTVVVGSRADVADLTGQLMEKVK